MIKLKNIIVDRFKGKMKGKVSQKIRTEVAGDDPRDISFVNREHLYGFLKSQINDYYARYDCINVDLDYISKIFRIYRKIDFTLSDNIHLVVNYLSKTINARCDQDINAFKAQLSSKQEKLHIQIRSIKRLSGKIEECFTSKKRLENYKYSLIRDRKSSKHNISNKYFSQSKRASISKEFQAKSREKIHMVEPFNFIKRQEKGLKHHKSTYKHINYTTITYKQQTDSTNHKIEENSQETEKRMPSEIREKEGNTDKQTRNEFSDMMIQREWIRLQLKKQSLRLPRKELMQMSNMKLLHF